MSSTPSRRVLQSLDVNTNPSSVTKSPNLSKHSREKAFLSPSQNTRKQIQNPKATGLGCAKWHKHMDIHPQGPAGRVLPEVFKEEVKEEDLQVQSQKLNGKGVIAEDGSSIMGDVHGVEESENDGVSVRAGLSTEGMPRSPTGLHAMVSPMQSSPASTCVSSNAGMDDSQDTVITVPDDVHAVAATHSFSSVSARVVGNSLTRKEIRQRAAQMKLRLSLASYKVRTNQINIPISRLELRATSPQLPTLPRARTGNGNSNTTPKKRTPLPAAASSSSPILETRKPSQEKHTSYPHIPSSPPCAEAAAGEQANPAVEEPTTREAITPILPRQKAGMLNPPKLGSPIWAELTSSVVKGRAADGLLSLANQLR